MPSLTAAAPAPPPLRHCAGQHKAVHQLAACRRLPRHILHRARGCATGFVSPAVAVPPAPAFALSGLSRVRPAACAISFAHGFVGYAGVPLAVPHFVARRRLPAVKRTAARAGVAGCKIKTVPPAALRLHSAATRPNTWPRPVLIPAPFRRSHTPKANPLRGIADQRQHPGQFAALNCTLPGGGKFAAARRALT